MFRVERNVINVVFMMLCLYFLTSCVASTGMNNPVIDNTYKILKTTQIGYDSSMKIVSDLYRQGKITEEQKQKVVKIGSDFVASYKFLVSVLETYAEGKTSRITVDEAVDKFVEIQISFINLVRELMANE